jgi:inorganic pyrophosphatase/exopolyphosphatase
MQKIADILNGSDMQNKADMRNAVDTQKASNMSNVRDLKEFCTQIAIRRISISDIEGQLDLLRRGFKGFRIANKSEGAQIFYGKF